MVAIQANSLLSQAGQVTLNGAGYGLLRFAPQGELWEVESITMQCSDYAGPPVSESIGRIYQGSSVNPMNLKATAVAASSGSTASANGAPLRLTDGQPMWVEWTGGTPGVTATVTFTGIKSDPQGGFRAIR